MEPVSVQIALVALISSRKAAPVLGSRQLMHPTSEAGWQPSLRDVNTYQQIIECIPLPAHFSDQRRRNKRTNCSTHTIEPMETPENFMRIGQAANPHVPPCVLNTASQSNEDIHDHQDREWRVRRYDSKSE